MSLSRRFRFPWVGVEFLGHRGCTALTDSAKPLSNEVLSGIPPTSHPLSTCERQQGYGLTSECKVSSVPRKEHTGSERQERQEKAIYKLKTIPQGGSWSWLSGHWPGS